MLITTVSFTSNTSYNILNGMMKTNTSSSLANLPYHQTCLLPCALLSSLYTVVLSPLPLSLPSNTSRQTTLTSRRLLEYAKGAKYSTLSCGLSTAGAIRVLPLQELIRLTNVFLLE